MHNSRGCFPDHRRRIALELRAVDRFHTSRQTVEPVRVALVALTIRNDPGHRLRMGSGKPGILENLQGKLEHLIHRKCNVITPGRCRSFLFHRKPSLCWLASPYRSEEHTSELQSRGHLVCRLLLEK